MNEKPYRDSDREKAERDERRSYVASIVADLRWLASFIEADERGAKLDDKRSQVWWKIKRVCQFLFSEC